MQEVLRVSCEGLQKMCLLQVSDLFCPVSSVLYRIHAYLFSCHK